MSLVFLTLSHCCRFLLASFLFWKLLSLSRFRSAVFESWFSKLSAVLTVCPNRLESAQWPINFHCRLPLWPLYFLAASILSHSQFDSQKSCHISHCAFTAGFSCIACHSTHTLPGPLHLPADSGGCFIISLNLGSFDAFMQAPGTSQDSTTYSSAAASLKKMRLFAGNSMCEAVCVSPNYSSGLIRTPLIAHITLCFSSPSYYIVFELKIMT